MFHPRGRPRRLGRGKAWHYAAFATIAAGMLAAGGVGFASGGVSSGTSNDTWSLTLGSMTEQYIWGDPAGYELTGTPSGPATLTGSVTTESSSADTVVFQPNLTVQVTVPSTMDNSYSRYSLFGTVTEPTGIPSGVSVQLRNITRLPASESTSTNDLRQYGAVDWGGCNCINRSIDPGTENFTTVLTSTPTRLEFYGGTVDTDAITTLYNWSAWDLLMYIPANTTIPGGQYTGAVTITGEDLQSSNST